MKKIVSGVVLVVILALASLPLAAAANSDNAMACCRVHGTHHCSDSSDSGAQHSFNAACPYHSRAMLVSASVATVQQARLSIELTASLISRQHQLSGTSSIASDPSGRAPPHYSA